MQRFASGPGPFAFFDAPWTPIFLFVLFAFHWLLGLLAVFSGVALLVLALLNQMRTARLQSEAGKASARAFALTEQMRAGGETVRGLGKRGALGRTTPAHCPGAGLLRRSAGRDSRRGGRASRR